MGRTLLTLFLPLSLAMAGCAVTAPRRDAPPAAANGPSEASPKLFWWSAQFRVAWPKDAETDWGPDLLLAHAVVKPALERHARELTTWRFHRRAVRDDAGHRFSFYFYAEAAAAERILSELQASPVLAEARASGMVEAVALSDPAKPSRPGIEDLSDPSWPPTLQRNWPWYARGASELWLGLIDDRVGEVQAAPGGGAIDLLETYRKAQEELAALWNKNGQHAFLHHLGAIFGYAPLRVVTDAKF